MENQCNWIVSSRVSATVIALLTPSPLSQLTSSFGI